MDNGKYFLQYLTHVKDDNVYGDCYALANGFSDTYSLCKSIGKFIWLDQSIDEFPIKEGTVYISAFQIFNIYQIYKWAQQLKKVKFIVGGSAIDSGFLNLESIEFPSNVMITSESVEKLFGFKDFTFDWGIDIPDEIVKDKPLLFSYTIDNNCYWGKCSFCRYPQQLNKNRHKQEIKFEFKNIKPGTKKSVWIQSPSLTPTKMKYIIPRLPVQDDLNYILFLRGNKQEVDALEELYNTCDFDFSKLTIFIGVEFPSNRMLKWMNKGTTTDEIINFLNQTNKIKAKTITSYILGWNNLIEDDLREADQFIKSLPKTDLNYQKIFKLSIVNDTEFYNRFKDDLYEVKCGPFSMYHMLKINQQQYDLNKRAKNIIMSNGYKTKDNYE